MPNIGVYHQTVEPNKFVAPINLDVYQKGLEHQEGIAKENLNILSSVYGELSNIPAYGVDAIELHKQMDGLKNELLSSNLSNLSDPNSFSQINSIINKAKNNPRVAEIAKRGTIYSQELAKKQKAEEKGISYTSPALDSLSKYYNGQNFYETSNNLNLNSGWITPDMAKKIKEAREYSMKTIYDPATGQVKQVASPEDIMKNFQLLTQNDPNFQKDFEYSFQKKTEGVDWNDEGQNFIQQEANRLMDIFNQPRLVVDVETAQMAKNEYDRLIKLADPSLIGEELKNKYRQSYLRGEIEKVGYSADVSNFEKFERDPLQMQTQKFINDKALKEIEHNYRMSEFNAKEKEKAKAEQLALSTKDPLKKSLVLIGIKEGLSYELLDDSQPDGIKTTEELIRMGLKQEESTEESTKNPVREDITSFRQIFTGNQKKVKKLIESKLGGDLGVGGFNENDIEKVTWNKDTNRYEIEVDDSWYGKNETISLTQDEVNDLNKVVFKKGDEVLEIPLTDRKAIDVAIKEGYIKE